MRILCMVRDVQKLRDFPFPFRHSTGHLRELEEFTPYCAGTLRRSSNADHSHMTNYLLGSMHARADTDEHRLLASGVDVALCQRSGSILAGCGQPPLTSTPWLSEQSMAASSHTPVICRGSGAFVCTLEST